MAQGQTLQYENDKSSSKDLITIFRNQDKQHYHYSLEQYFYSVFTQSTFKKGDDNTNTQEMNIDPDQHRILIPKGMNCKLQFPVDYDYARGMLIMHKLWHKNMTLERLLKNKQNTINEFLQMIDAKEVPTSVQAWYLTALKYATNKTKKLEVLVKEGVNHPEFEDKNNDEETNQRITGWLHGSHLKDNKLLSNSINNITVDIGKNKDLSITDYEQTRQTTIDEKEYLTQITNMYYNNNKSIDTAKTLKIPMTKNGEEYSINSLASEQKKVVLDVIDTIIKFLWNQESYIPFHATVVSCGGTGKSNIINTILTIVRKLTKRNTTILVGASSGAAAYNVQG